MDPNPHPPLYDDIVLDIPCRVCSRIDLNNRQSEYYWTNTRWLVSEVTTNYSCRLCRVLMWMYTSTPDHNRYVNGVITGTIIYPPSKNPPYCLSVDLRNEFRGVEAFECSYMLYSVCSGSPGRFIRDLQYDARLVRGWIEDCNSSHDCVPKDTTRNQGRNHKPYVVDVNQSCVRQLPRYARYAALSYVWGQVDQPVLTEDNLEKLKRPGSLTGSNLPRTINEALGICQSLDIRYLWVDSLCIVQERADGQIAHMHEIYNDSYITLIAGVGSDCNASIFKPKRLECTDHAANIGGRLFVAAPAYLEPLEHRLYSSTWNTRAWTIQEYALSRRCLIFTSYEYFMYCGKAVYIQTLTEPLKSRYSFGRSLLSHRLSKLPPEGVGRRHYAQLVSLYNKRKLLYQHDILRAFDGMANMLSPHLGNFLAGMPQDMLRWSLCWMNFDYILPRRGFPSWSWAGWIHDDQRSSETNVQFPEFDFKPMWPRCLVYQWTSPGTAHLLKSREELPDRYLSRTYNDKIDCPSDLEHVVWMNQAQPLQAHETVSHVQGFEDFDIKNVVSFRSSMIVFRAPASEPRDLPQNTTTSSTYTTIPTFEYPPTPYYHEQESYSREEHAYILLAHSDRWSTIIALPILINHRIYKPSRESQDIILARRAGNPQRIHHRFWSSYALKCLVHLW